MSEIWKIVPLDLTAQMRRAAAVEASTESAYAAMLQAAPQPESDLLAGYEVTWPVSGAQLIPFVLVKDSATLTRIRASGTAQLTPLFYLPLRERPWIAPTVPDAEVSEEFMAGYVAGVAASREVNQ